MTEQQLQHAAELLGYEEIRWTTTEDGDQCYAGFGSSDPADRSKDDPAGYFVASDDEDLAALLKQYQPEA